MRPPIPTTDKPSDNDDQKQRRAALIPMAIGLVAIGAFGIYAIWDGMQPRQIRPMVTGQMTEYDDHGMGIFGEFNSDSPLSTVAMAAQPLSQLMLVHPTDRQLLSEPAGLTPLPDGERLSAFTRADGHLSEEVSFCTAADGWTMDQVLDHYQKSAQSIGFKPLPVADPNEKILNRIYVRSGDAEGAFQAQQVLIVRITEHSDGPPRVLLWYRYTVKRS